MVDNPAEKKYPLTCPVCSVAMIGQKSDPESEAFELHRCFNCGTVIYETGAVVEGDEQD